MLTQHVAVWMRMQNAKIQFVTAVRNTLILMERAKQVSLIIIVTETGIHSKSLLMNNCCIF